jgi:hypothetical protein
VQNEWERQNPSIETWRDRLDRFLGRRRRSSLEKYYAYYALDYYEDDEATEILTTTLQPLRDVVLSVLNTTEFPQFDRPLVDIAIPGWLFQKVPLFRDEDENFPREMYITAHSRRHFTSRISTAVHRTGFRLSSDTDPMNIMRAHFNGDRTGGPLAAPDMALRQAFSSINETSRTLALVKWETLGNNSLVSVWVENVDRRYLEDQASFTSLTIPAGSSGGEVLALLSTIARAVKHAKMELDTSDGISGGVPSALLAGSKWTFDSSAQLESLLPDLEFKTMQDVGPLVALGAAKQARDLYSWYFVGCELEEPMVIEDEREL